jgi:Ni,Fe-hydrogenase I large subunit
MRARRLILYAWSHRRSRPRIFHLMADEMVGWVNQLGSNLAHGKVSIFNPTKWEPSVGRVHTRIVMAGMKAPRGALRPLDRDRRWNHQDPQAVTFQTTWNVGPRDAQGQGEVP